VAKVKVKWEKLLGQAAVTAVSKIIVLVCFRWLTDEN